jgi:hypothetical protein
MCTRWEREGDTMRLAAVLVSGDVTDSISARATVDTGKGPGADYTSTFSVASGSCTVTADNCFRSANYPDSYPNNDTCSIILLVPDTLVVRAFNTESGYDVLTVNSVPYSGNYSSGPEGVNVTSGTSISWSSDHNFPMSGFEICGTAPPTVNDYIRATALGELIRSGSLTAMAGEVYVSTNILNEGISVPESEVTASGELRLDIDVYNMSLLVSNSSGVNSNNETTRISLSAVMVEGNGSDVTNSISAHATVDTGKEPQAEYTPTFSVANGSCTVTVDNCFRSANYPNEDYPSDDACSIIVLVPDTLVVRALNTESGSDFLTIYSVRYSGNNSGPEGVSVSLGTSIGWSSDGSDTRSGFEICGTAPPPSPPAPNDYIRATALGDLIRSGSLTPMAAAVNVSTNILHEGIGVLESEVTASGEFRLDRDVYSMSLLVSDSLNANNTQKVANLSATMLEEGSNSPKMEVAVDVSTNVLAEGSSPNEVDFWNADGRLSLDADVYATHLNVAYGTAPPPTASDYVRAIASGARTRNGSVNAMAGEVYIRTNILHEGIGVPESEVTANGELRLDTDVYNMSLLVGNSLGADNNTLKVANLLATVVESSSARMEVVVDVSTNVFAEGGSPDELDFWSAGGHIFLDADEYTTNLNVTYGSVPRSDYNQTRNGVCTNECTQHFLVIANTTGPLAGRLCHNILNSSVFDPWGGEDCEYFPYPDGVCTDGGAGSAGLLNYADMYGYISDTYGFSHPLAYGSDCALGSDCADCSALKMDFASVTLTGEGVFNGGNSTKTMVTSVNVTTNFADFGIDPLLTELRADSELRLDDDTLSMTVALNDNLRQDVKKEGNLKVHLAGFDSEVLLFDLNLTEVNGSYTVATNTTLFDEPVLGARVVSNSNLGVLSARVEAPESFLVPMPYLMTLETDGYGVGGSTDNRLRVNMLHQVSQSCCCIMLIIIMKTIITNMLMPVQQIV